MARWVDREKPDLICISNGGFDDNLALAQVCASGRTPYAVIAHANAECMWPDDEPARVLIDVYGRAQRAFFVSNANRELLEMQLGIRLSNAEVVWNPVGMRETKVVPWPSASEPLQLACVARLHPKSKGQDLVLQVLAREVWRTRPVTVSFYGSGDNLESLQRLSRLLGVEDRVRFCGHTNDIDKVWKTHHALVLTSRYEGLPIALVEAMLAGRPAIVTRVGGNAEIVEHGVTGFVAAAPTVHHVATVMEEAWQQRNRWAAMGKDGAQRLARLLPANPAAAFSEKLLGLL
jgi:glycosyltransferase involved in cell wall biosynthesis